jgi:hypothetical protein
MVPKAFGINDFIDYPYSSASFYEKGSANYDKLQQVNEILM